MSGTFPTSVCGLCDSWEHCQPSRLGQDVETSSCFHYRRAIHLDHAKTHFSDLRKTFTDRNLVDKLDKTESFLLSLLAKAQQDFSGLLEFSLAVNGTPKEAKQRSSYRFSYSFAEWEYEERGSSLAVAKLFFTLLGPEVGGHAKKLLALARTPLVQQLLVGLDAHGENVRNKIYFQFNCGHEEKKQTWLAHLLPEEVVQGYSGQLERLHLVGVDFTGQGLSGIKLYFLFEMLSSDEIRIGYADNPLMMTLANTLPSGLKEFLSVSRHSQPDLSAPKQELDFGLVASGLTPAIMQTFRVDSRLTDALESLETLGAGRHWWPTRLSMPKNGEGRLNLYYLLLDPPESGKSGSR